MPDILFYLLRKASGVDIVCIRRDGNNKHKTKDRIMTYSRACEILGFTTPKSFAANAALAASRLRTFTANAPLRYRVAVNVLIQAAK